MLQEKIEEVKSAEWDVKVLEETFPEVPVPIFRYLLQREDTLENVIKFLKGRGWKAQKSVSSDKHTLLPFYHGLPGSDTTARMSHAQPHTYIVTFERGSGYRCMFRDTKGKLNCIKLGVGEGPEVPSHLIKKYKLSDGIPRPSTRLVCSRCEFTPCKLKESTSKHPKRSKMNKYADSSCSMPQLGNFKTSPRDTSHRDGHTEEVVRYPLYIPTKAELTNLVVAHTQTVFI